MAEQMEPGGGRTLARLLHAPCVFCAYDGAGYYQTGTHAERCPWRDIGGEYKRIEALAPTLRNLAAFASANEGRALRDREGNDDLGSLIDEATQNGFSAGLEAAARYMESRQVTASDFYVREIRALSRQGEGKETPK